MSIYIHIPFCLSICTYCDFSKVYYDSNYVKSYLQSLAKEIEDRYQGEIVKTIYIGGGTPTSLNEEELTILLELTKKFNLAKDIEFTIEGNIESITPSKLKIIKKYGVNRLSIGIESFNKDIIKLLGRKHTKEEVIKKISLIKKYFTNINIDLIYAAYNNIDILKEDIKTFLSLDIPHLSAYSLIIEDNTILKINKFPSIPEDIDYQMYKYIENTLEENNYYHYEISNYAKKGYESKHNLTYWHNQEYYGFGLSSVSYLQNIRRENTKNLTKYLHNEYLKEENYENKQVQMENEIMLALRLTKGLDLHHFKLKYHEDITKEFNINPLIEEGYLIKEDNYLKINKDYLYVSNQIILKILS